MKFFGRQEEVEMLRRWRDVSAEEAQFVVITGRRRVGKTALLRNALDDGVIPYVHLPITRQSERMLCRELQAEVEQILNLGILGTCETFSDLFKIIMKASQTRRFTVVFDEFQEFDRINDAVFSQVAAIWDEYHSSSKINLVVCGSINRLMNKIFFNDGEPLYGRTTASFMLKPFKVSLLKQILSEFKPDYTPEDLSDWRRRTLCEHDDWGKGAHSQADGQYHFFTGIVISVRRSRNTRRGVRPGLWHILHNSFGHSFWCYDYCGIEEPYRRRRQRLSHQT